VPASYLRSTGTRADLSLEHGIRSVVAQMQVMEKMLAKAPPYFQREEQQGGKSSRRCGSWKRDGKERRTVRSVLQVYVSCPICRGVVRGDDGVREITPCTHFPLTLLPIVFFLGVQHARFSGLEMERIGGRSSK